MLFSTSSPLARAGAETVVHTFPGHRKGYHPFGKLVQLGRYLYSTTLVGAAISYGSVFRLLPDGAEKLLHGFDHADGIPAAARSSRSSRVAVKPLYVFTGQADGGLPHAPLATIGDILSGDT